MAVRTPSTKNENEERQWRSMAIIDYGKLLADEGATMQVLNEEQTANVGGRKNQINAKLKVFQSFSEVCVVPHK